MPLHDFRGGCGCTFDQMVAHGVNEVPCPKHPHMLAQKVFLTAPAGFVQRDICYDSPIDGRAITSKQARIEDLRRNDCVEYDPGMRQDAAKRRAQAEVELDRSVDATVDEFFATAPTRKLEKLDQEIRAGASVDLVRSTPDASALT